jgi:hypothetical protein
MSTNPNDGLLSILLSEYEKLKDEQIQRIGFRDNMLYVTLVTVGGVVSITFGGSNNLAPLLLVPWICVILGWTYLINDEKISSIGKYIRLKLDKCIRQQIAASEQAIFGWELEHRSDARRSTRKVLQFFIDEFTFCLSGISAIGIYLIFEPTKSPLTIMVSFVEGIFLVVLGIQIALYADLRRDRKSAE